MDQEIVEKVREYLLTLTLNKRDKDEVENLVLGYIVDCEAKDRRIDEIEAENEELKRRLAVWEALSAAHKQQIDEIKALSIEE